MFNNEIRLSGRLAKDPEMPRKTQSGLSVLAVDIAVNRRKNKQGEVIADFFRVQVWGAQADNLFQYVHKGDEIHIIGRIQNNNYEKNGKTVYQNAIIADEVVYGAKKRNNGEYEAKQEQGINSTAQAKTTLRPKEIDVSNEFQPTLTGGDTFYQSDIEGYEDIKMDDLPFY